MGGNVRKEGARKSETKKPDTCSKSLVLIESYSNQVSGKLLLSKTSETRNCFCFICKNLFDNLKQLKLTATAFNEMICTQA